MIPFVNWLIAKKNLMEPVFLQPFMRSCICLISLGTDFSFSFGLGEQTHCSAIIFAFVFVLTAELAQIRHHHAYGGAAWRERPSLPCLRALL